VASAYFILGTAGHIDHGKTSLVRALTGVDTDRLPEEKRRGMTIELGFASLTIGELCFGVVDVPGHERFVRTMVAGATGIDVALLVVAADDSVMPQTREHVEILDLLGVTRGVVAITKCDVADDDMIGLVGEEVRELLSPTSLKASPICAVSSRTGRGLAELKSAIYHAAVDAQSPPLGGPFRMAVDRVFTVAGRGTVVTGSVLSGSVAEGNPLEIWPSGETCKVRGLQTHGESAGLLARGQRAAINLSGVDRDRLDRGMELATPGFLEPTRLLDVRLQCLAAYGKPLKSSTTLRLEIGTAELSARVVLLSDKSLAPGNSDYAQLRCGRPLTAVHGQRFILRDENAVRTVGGGVVLRPVAARRRPDKEVERAMLQQLEDGDSGARLEAVLRQTRFTTPSAFRLAARSGVSVEKVPEVFEQLKREDRLVEVGHTRVFIVPVVVDDLEQRLSAWLVRFHQAHPQLPGRSADAVIGWLERMAGRAVARALFEELGARKAFKLLGKFLCAPAFAPSLTSADEKALATMIAEIKAGGFQPPGLAELSVAGKGDRKRLERLATLAVALGELVGIDGSIYLHADIERALRENVAALIRVRGPVTVAEVREALSSSRKFVVPFLEYLDRVGVTRREGDARTLREG